MSLEEYAAEVAAELRARDADIPFDALLRFGQKTWPPGGPKITPRQMVDVWFQMRVVGPMTAAGWRRPRIRGRCSPGAASLRWDAIFEAVFSFYEGCSDGGLWGSGGSLFGIELAREVLGVQKPGQWWVFALAFRYLLDDALGSCAGGVLTCGAPGQLAEFRRRVVDFGLRS